MNNEKGDSRLIWQGHSPLPYESAWSFIHKILLLNSIGPEMLVSFIYNKGKTARPKVLNHRDSSWIDFEKFSNLLGVNNHQLKKGFLVEMGLVTKPLINKEIKYCPRCLEKGFHSVFFDIDIIASCPWHQVPLKKCMECNISVTRKPLRREFVQHGDFEWQIRRSKCNHIYLDDRKIGRTHSLSDLEVEEIRLQSEAIERWLLKLSQESNIIDQINNAETYHSLRPEVTESLLSFATSIAGPCPWTVEHNSFSVRSIIWSADIPPKKQHNTADITVEYSSEFGKSYKSIKNFFFNRYVRHHRRCWKCLTHYDLISAINLNTDTICHVCVAFATWRMVNEGRQEVSKLHEAEDGYKLRVLKVYDQFLDDASPNEEIDASVSIEEFSKALYAQFFLIWRTVIIERKLNLYLDSGGSNSEPYFPLLKSNSVKSIIYPSPEYFKNASRKTCKRLSREDCFMLIPWANVFWFDTRKERRALDNNMIFKISVEVENILSGKKAHKWLSF